MLSEGEGNCKTQQEPESQQPRGNAKVGSCVSGRDVEDRDPFQVDASFMDALGNPGETRGGRRHLLQQHLSLDPCWLLPSPSEGGFW